MGFFGPYQVEEILFLVVLKDLFCFNHGGC